MSTTAQDEPVRAKLVAAMATDVGMVREHNEDSSYIAPERGFFIVADGMGGHAAGEVASAMAVDRVRIALEEANTELEAFATSPTDDARRELVKRLQAAVLAAHQAVYERGTTEKDKEGMGTTLDVCVVSGREAFIAHVGDSRTYLIRNGRASQITTDHTVAQVRVIEGTLSAEEAAVSPWRTILVNAIGVSPDVGVELAHVQLRAGDRLLLCSDGLHDYFPADDEIASKLSLGEPAGRLNEMIELAKERGGHDNITGVVVDVLDIVNRAGLPIDRETTSPVMKFGPEGTAEATADDITLSDTLERPIPVPAELRKTAPMASPMDPAATAPGKGGKGKGGKGKGKGSKEPKAKKAKAGDLDRSKIGHADTLPPTAIAISALMTEADETSDTLPAEAAFTSDGDTPLPKKR